jgi:hypothetical protein
LGFPQQKNSKVRGRKLYSTASARVTVRDFRRGNSGFSSQHSIKDIKSLQLAGAIVRYSRLGASMNSRVCDIDNDAA